MCFKWEVEQPVYKTLVFKNSRAVHDVPIHDLKVRFLGALSTRKIMGSIVFKKE
jgi:hypothetical protein